jgi:hypothetical protein
MNSKQLEIIFKEKPSNMFYICLQSRLIQQYVCIMADVFPYEWNIHKLTMYANIYRQSDSGEWKFAKRPLVAQMTPGFQNCITSWPLLKYRKIY